MGRISTMAFYVGHCLGDFRLMSILMTIPSIGALIGIAEKGMLNVRFDCDSAGGHAEHRLMSQIGG